MKEVQLLDVTLRDGGYCNNFNFGKLLSDKLIKSLSQANIDYVEIGYRNGSAKNIPNIGPNGLCDSDFIHYLRQNNPTTKLVVILHAKNCDEADIRELADAGISMLRFCITAKVTEHDIKLIQLAKELGLIVCGNITRVSERTAEQLYEVAAVLNELKVDYIYLADSNGSLTPEKTAALFSELAKRCTAKLGFHAHNNMGLAMSNTLAAIAAGATIVDSSLTGLGKGGGNLVTEEIVAYLQRSVEANRYDFRGIIEVLEHFRNQKVITSDGQTLKSLLMGVFDLSMDDTKSLNNSDIHQYYESANQVSDQKKRVMYVR